MKKSIGPKTCLFFLEELYPFFQAYSEVLKALQSNEQQMSKDQIDLERKRIEANMAKSRIEAETADQRLQNERLKMKIELMKFIHENSLTPADVKSYKEMAESCLQ